MRPHGGMQVVDLAYLADGRETALVAAAGRRGCDTSSTGSTCSCPGRSGLRALDGLPAPLVAMRAALRR